MNSTTETVLEILRVSLFGGKLSLPDNIDWNEVYKELRIHAIAWLPGCILPDLIGVENGMMKVWGAGVLQNMRRQYHMLQEQDTLLRLLDTANIRTVVLKGTAAATYYPQPDYRCMGDIDLLVQRGKAEAAFRLMLEHGYQLTHSVDHNKRHYNLNKNGVEFEIHASFSTLSDEKQSAYLDNLLYAGMNRMNRCELFGFSFPILPELQNGLVLLAHVNQHMTEGVGLRHVLDWVMYVATTLDDTFWKEHFQTEVNRLGLERFAVVMTRMAQLYLGLTTENRSWCAIDDEEVCADMLAFILDNGDFGFKLGRQRDVRKVLSSAGSVREMFSMLQKDGCYNFRRLIAKYPMVEPFAWLLRIFRLLLLGFKQKIGLKEFRVSYKASRARVELFNNLGVREVKAEEH